MNDKIAGIVVKAEANSNMSLSYYIIRFMGSYQSNLVCLTSGIGKPSRANLLSDIQCIVLVAFPSKTAKQRYPPQCGLKHRGYVFKRFYPVDDIPKMCLFLVSFVRVVHFLSY